MTERTEADRDTDHPMAELRDLGLLWLINRVVFHPRGFALAFYGEDDGTVRRWTLLGDGTEPWTMGDAPEDDLFATVEAFLDGLRPPVHRASRLADALHRLHAHPDYEYVTTECGRKQSTDLIYPQNRGLGDGWEENVVDGDPHSSWERFEYHEEHYWRRRKQEEPTPGEPDDHDPPS